MNIQTINKSVPCTNSPGKVAHVLVFTCTMLTFLSVELMVKFVVGMIFYPKRKYVSPSE